MRDYASRPEVREALDGYMELVEEGYRGIYRIVRRPRLQGFHAEEAEGAEDFLVRLCSLSSSLRLCEIGMAEASVCPSEQ
jgi:hypothetical protein